MPDDKAVGEKLTMLNGICTMCQEELMGKSWFKHDVNARHDPKMVLMRASYGVSGYGLFWMLVETLRETQGYKFPKKHLAALGLDYGYPDIERFVRDCIDTFELLSEDDEYVWSESLLTRMKNYEKLCEERAEYGKRGGVARAKHELSKSQGFAIAKCSEENRLDKNRLDKNRLDKKDKEAYADYVHMTKKEYDNLIFLYGATKTKEMISILDNYKGSKGKQYKNDYRAILSWVVEKCGAKRAVPVYTPKVPEKEAIDNREEIGVGLSDLRKKIR